MPPKTHSRRRTWVVGLGSLAAAAAFLGLASTRLTLWPETLSIAEPALVALAAVAHVPYAIVRAMRLRYVLDPLVAPAAAGRRFDRSLLYGSGFVSFFVLLILPLKLGELSRPMLLARGRAPGVGLPEAAGAVALERLVDGVLIVAMLFGGLALSPPRVDLGVADVRSAGLAMCGVFVAGLLLLVGAARRPAWAVAAVASVAAVLGRRAREMACSTTARIAGTTGSLLSLQRLGAFLGWSLVYWAVTVGQLWLVLEGCGVRVGVGAAVAIVAIVGLSIQLPGGPAQVGTFQMGTGVALSLYLDESGLALEGSTFAAVMFVVQLAGSAGLAVAGAWLLARAAASATVRGLEGSQTHPVGGTFEPGGS